MKLDLIDYYTLPLGETQQGPCPVCGKMKFYVTRKNDGLAYICFRASCHTQGFVGGTGYTNTPHEQIKNVIKPKNTRWTGRFYDADNRTRIYFSERFGVEMETEEELRYWVRTTDDGRYVFPLWGPDDMLRGHLIRRATWSGYPAAPISDSKDEGYPKAMTYIDPDVPKCGWYHSMDERTVVLVEDCVSAMRIAGLGVTAVALLGTTLSPKVLGELLRWKQGERYILALDPDANNKAMKIQKDFGPAFRGGLYVARLQQDPKDYQLDEDLEYALGI
jgi:hypothetical protein